MSEAPEPTSRTPVGEHLLVELKLVHGAIRHDLRACKELAAEVADGASAEAVRERVRELKTNGPLWRLRINCLYYCRFRLESEHREVADHLSEIEAAAEALLEDEGPESRSRVVRALNAVTDLLLAHLAYEEESLAPAILAWAEWPR